MVDEDTLNGAGLFLEFDRAVVKYLFENKVKVGECMCGSIAQCDREGKKYRKRSCQDG